MIRISLYEKFYDYRQNEEMNDCADDLVLLVKAQSQIERDALIARLNAEGVESKGAEHVLSRKLTSTTIDFSYEGYSALSDNTFAIYVHAADLSKGQQIVDDKALFNR